jgi:predicted nucleic acid-binding protein
MIYFDSNYIIKCYLNEPGSREVLALAQSHPGRACALHGRLEFWSGIRRHAREKTLSARDVEGVFRQFIQDEAANLWLFLPVEESLIRRACSQLGALPDDVPCRAADALHLTCAVENGFAEIYSNDRHLLAAAAHFGLKGTNVIPWS